MGTSLVGQARCGCGRCGGAGGVRGGGASGRCGVGSTAAVGRCICLEPVGACTVCVGGYGSSGLRMAEISRAWGRKAGARAGRGRQDLNPTPPYPTLPLPHPHPPLLPLPPWLLCSMKRLPN